MSFMVKPQMVEACVRQYRRGCGLYVVVLVLSGHRLVQSTQTGDVQTAATSVS